MRLPDEGNGGLASAGYGRETRGGGDLEKPDTRETLAAPFLTLSEQLQSVRKQVLHPEDNRSSYTYGRHTPYDMATILQSAIDFMDSAEKRIEESYERARDSERREWDMRSALWDAYNHMVELRYLSHAERALAVLDDTLGVDWKYRFAIPGEAP